MDIENLTLKQIREIGSLFQATPSNTEGAWKIGRNYLIRTVTMFQTGRLVAVYPQELVLEDAAWIPDTGQFAQAVEKSQFKEVEPFPDNRQVIVGRGSVIDAVEIQILPRSIK